MSHEDNGPFASTSRAPTIEQLELEDLSPGDVVIRVAWSGINYKDALAATGAGKILRKYPLVGGIDLAGVVESVERCALQAGRTGARHRRAICRRRLTAVMRSSRACRATRSSRFPRGSMSARRWASAPRDSPPRSPFIAWSRTARRPAHGPVVVTGATGGVGSLAIDMLAARGLRSVADQRQGAGGRVSASRSAPRSVLLRQSVEFGIAAAGARAVRRRRSTTSAAKLLGWLTRTVAYGGNIASVGLAGGAKLETTVMPFILRAVNLLGINSVATPRDRAARGVEAHRFGPGAAPPRPHRHARNRLRLTRR